MEKIEWDIDELKQEIRNLRSDNLKLSKIQSEHIQTIKDLISEINLMKGKLTQIRKYVYSHIENSESSDTSNSSTGYHGCSGCDKYECRCDVIPRLRF